MQQLEPSILALLATALELLLAWLIFRVVPKSWREDRFGAYVIVFGFLVAINWALFNLSASGWLAKPENASTVQAVSTAAQAVFAVVLIGVAVFTLRANADMARETEKMAAAAIQQQRAATRPVLVFRIHPGENKHSPDAKEFVIEVVIVGAAPALDARVSYTGPFNCAEPKDYVQPLVIAAGENPGFTFELNEDAPLRDSSDRLKWPRTPKDAELESEFEALETAGFWRQKGTPEYERRSVVRWELRNRSNRYYADLTAHIAEQSAIGQVRAEYFDLGGEAHVSTADLEVINPDSRLAVERKAARLAELSGDDIHSFTPYWPKLKLGLLRVKSASVSPGNEEGAT